MRDQRGLTLIELLVVMTALAILFAMVLPALDSPVRDAKAQVVANDLEQLRLALLRFNADMGVWPADNDPAPDNGLSDVDLMGGSCGSAGSQEPATTNDPGLVCQGTSAGRVAVGPLNNGLFDSTVSAAKIIARWRGPYIKREVKSNPYGGSYILHYESINPSTLPGSGTFHPTATAQEVLLRVTNISQADAMAVDRLIDDGNLTTGLVRHSGTEIRFVVAVY